MKSSKRHFLTTVAAIAGTTFASTTGGAETSAVNKWYDGGDTGPDVVVAPPETSNVTVTNAFDPDIDAALITTLKSQVGILRTTITRVPLYADMTRVPGAKPDVYTN